MTLDHVTVSAFALPIADQASPFRASREITQQNDAGHFPFAGGICLLQSRLIRPKVSL